MHKTLHITNGDALNDRLLSMEVQGDFAVWREMLCEGKTTVNLASDTFKKTRIAFFNVQYPEHAGNYDDIFGSQLAIIADAHLYKEVVLWFEYDLFCHINMLACISFLKTSSYSGDIFLVCSGWIEGETELYGLSQLSSKQLQDHYRHKVLLDNHDLFLADDLWRIYCGKDHLKLKPERAKDSNFKYLSNCISAHKERFPNVKTGLNTLETNMLHLIRKYEIKSTHQLCGYMLNYQGYYGYGDIQFLKMIEHMKPFYDKKDGVLILNDLGKNIIDQSKSVLNKMTDNTLLGGVSKYAYTFNEDDHQLTKIS